ncbi:hypothetical protein B0H13DRAFT_1990520, partial [Mycena leptocephala]
FIRTNVRPPDTWSISPRSSTATPPNCRNLYCPYTLSWENSSLIRREAVVGTIIAKSSQPRKRMDLIASLREKSDFLVRSVKEELLGDDDLAIELANGEHKTFGAQSFIWISLGAIFDALKELEDEAKASRSSRRR